MLHDLYLMSANPSQVTDTRRNFNHRALTFSEMAASCKRRGSAAREPMNRTARKNIFLAILEGAART